MRPKKSHEEDFRYEPAALTLLLDELAQQNEFIIIDLPLYPATYRNKVLPMARDVILLTDMSLAGLRDSIRICTQVQKAVPSARLLVVGCRPSSHDAGVTRAEFEKSLGRKLTMILPEDHKGAAMAAARGKPLAVAARGSKLTSALRQLASQLGEAKAEGSERLWAVWLDEQRVTQHGNRFPTHGAGISYCAGAGRIDGLCRRSDVASSATRL